MSISNLLKQNDYNIYSGNFSQGVVEVDTLKIKTGSNPERTLNTINNGSLQIDGNLFSSGIQLGYPSNSQTILDNYSITPSGYMLDFLQPSLNTFPYFVKISRIGNIVFIEIPNLSDVIGDGNTNTNPFITTTSIDPIYRPNSNSTGIIGYTTATNAYITTLVNITSSGIISIIPRPGTVNDSWDIVNVTGITIFSNTIVYII